MTTPASFSGSALRTEPSAPPEPPLDATPPWAPVGGSTIRPRRRLGTRSAASLLLAVAALVAVAGVAFAVGRTTAGATQTAAANRANGLGAFGQGQAPPDGDRLGDRVESVQGTVTAVNGATLTITLADGSTVEVTTDSSTTYHAQESASASDVATGSSVIVQVSGGLPGTSGTRTASDVTIAGN